MAQIKNIGRAAFSSCATVMVLALAAAVSGCGGGGDATAAPTKAAFVKQGNAICSQWQQKRALIFAKFSSQFSGQTVTKADKEQGVLELLRPYRHAISQLRQMTPPHGYEGKIAGLVAAMEDGAEKIQAHPLTALTSNTAFENANGRSTAFGLKECTF